MSGGYVDDDSFLAKYFKSWGFRTAKPTFEPGDEFEVFLTGVQDGVPVARIGDTILTVPDAPSALVDSKVAVRVTEFDADGHRGSCEFVEKVGESAF
jgi:hypothetical protein